MGVESIVVVLKSSRASLFALPVWACSLLLAGCSTNPLLPSTSVQAASFQPYERLQIGGLKASEYLTRRYGIFLGGILVENSEDHSTETGATAGPRFKTDGGGNQAYGSVSAVDRRGYFLTAAHCFENGRPNVLIYLDVDSSGNSHISYVNNPRIVWRGDAVKNGPDLALISIDRQLAYWFDWSDTVIPGGIAIAGGVNFDKKPIRFSPAELAGKIGSFSIKSDALGNSYATILHDAPTRDGDSGGPLVAVDGKLLGIETDGYPWPLKWVGVPRGRAFRPNLAWLRELIDDDARHHAYGRIGT